MSFLTEHELEEGEKSFFERLHYFFGKLLTVRDFVTEQRYFNEKRWLLNRQTIGWGVVCGMKVRVKTDCPTNNQVIVEPGLALDKYGNEIVIGSDQVATLFSKETPPPTETKEYYIAVRYKECLSEPVPAPISECEDVKARCNYSRVYEMFELKSFEELPVSGHPEPVIGCDEIEIEKCFAFVNPCKPRPKSEWIVLAKVVFYNKAITHIDNSSYRKWLWSNETLATCLKDTVYRARAGRPDRRQFVPLLSQTIKGLTYRDGRKLVMSKHVKDAWEVGTEPYHVTSDGKHIWVTDRQADYVHKIDRENNEIFPIDLKNPSWGIAFDCRHMWVTHPGFTPAEAKGKENQIKSKGFEEGVISKIDVQTGNVEQVSISQPNPKEIVFDGEYIWITHGQLPQLTKINVKTNAESPVPPASDDPIPLILVFDGEYIWVAFRNAINKIDRTTDAYVFPEHIKGHWNRPETMTFDGTHIWIAHENGVSKIDVSASDSQIIDTVSVGQNVGGSAFEGMYLWVAGSGSDNPRIYRLDIFHETFDEGSLQLEGSVGEAVLLSRMCFDGHFVWVTGHEEYEGQQSGVVYRLLT